MRPLPDVGSAHGAPMGRRNEINDAEFAVEFEIERMPWMDGDYDPGGAYWGSGNGKEYMFRAEGESADAVESVFIRATSLVDAKAQILAIYPNATFAASADLDSFVAAYTQAALWSTSNDRYEADPDNEPEMLDTGAYEMAPEAKAMFHAVCAEFLAANAELIEAAKQVGHTIEQSGHDLWLTSNGHGVGFWDRGLGELGDKLSEAAKMSGEKDLYVGDDDLIHVMGDHRYAVKIESETPGAGPI